MVAAFSAENIETKREIHNNFKCQMEKNIN